MVDYRDSNKSGSQPFFMVAFGNTSRNQTKEAIAVKYVCELCGTIYDEDLGNPRAGIQPGTEFAQLPVDYACPGCGYLKEAYDPVRPKSAPKNRGEKL